MPHDAAAAAELQALLRHDFPLATPLGARVAVASPGEVVLAAPLAPNLNRSGTAFAGSLNALATLAGWSWVWLRLRAEGLAAETVLQDSSIRYDRPVAADFTATCLAPPAAALDRFLGSLRRRGRARLRLEVRLADTAGPAASFTGRYVASGPALVAERGPVE